MNKAEIICYILSAYFLGISTGCCIFNIIHNSIYKKKPKKTPRLLKSIDEMPLQRVDKLTDADVKPTDADVKLTDADVKLTDVPKSCRLCCMYAMANGQKEEEPTGCEYHLPLQYDCRECPHWSESRYTAAFGRFVAEGFAAGISVNTEADT